MLAAAPEASPYVLSAIAVAGTLLGGMLAGGFGITQLNRQLRWQASDADRRYRIETERWAHSLLEERDRVLWAERRVLYARLLEAAHEWIEAIREVRDTDLRAPELEQVDVRNLADAEKVSPIAAAMLRAGSAYAAVLSEVRIVGHSTVIASAAKVQLDLIAAAREAAHDRDGVRDAHKELGFADDRHASRSHRHFTVGRGTRGT
jgi:hypothetical protein